MFEQIDDDEYERRQEKRRNDNFIVDDVDGEYADKGGEIWEYEEPENKANAKKNRKLNAKGNQDIEGFMQPASALAGKKMLVKKPQVKVSAAQSKDIMDDLMGELDDQDEEQLEDIYNARQIGTATNILEDKGQMAFNKDEELDLKYNVKTGPAGAADKKRSFNDIASKP